MTGFTPNLSTRIQLLSALDKKINKIIFYRSHKRNKDFVSLTLTDVSAYFSGS